MILRGVILRKLWCFRAGKNKVSNVIGKRAAHVSQLRTLTKTRL